MPDAGGCCGKGAENFSLRGPAAELASWRACVFGWMQRATCTRLGFLQDEVEHKARALRSSLEEDFCLYNVLES